MSQPSYAQNSNQFTYSDIKGRVDGTVNLNTKSLMIDTESTDKFYPATAVKLNENGRIVKAAATDNIFGFVALETRTNTHVANSPTSYCVIAYNDCYMTMEAGADIQAGQLLESSPEPSTVVTGDKVIPLTGNTQIGMAMNSAATGELFQVRISILWKPAA